MSDASNIGNWVTAASAVGSMILVWWKLSGRSEAREITPQPLKVQAAEQFALREHEHPQYITREHCHAMHEEARAAALEDRHAVTRHVEGIQRQIDHLRNEIKQDLAAHNKEAIARSDAIHGRITALVPQIAANASRIDDHIEDHRRRES